MERKSDVELTKWKRSKYGIKSVPLYAVFCV